MDALDLHPGSIPDADIVGNFSLKIYSLTQLNLVHYCVSLLLVWSTK